MGSYTCIDYSSSFMYVLFRRSWHIKTSKSWFYLWIYRWLSANIIAIMLLADVWRVLFSPFFRHCIIRCLYFSFPLPIVPFLRLGHTTHRYTSEHLLTVNRTAKKKSEWERQQKKYRGRYRDEETVKKTKAFSLKHIKVEKKAFFYFSLFLLFSFFLVSWVQLLFVVDE
jgi:hypothetical protein